MKKLTQFDLDFLSLIQRSDKIDGWANVSNLLWSLVANVSDGLLYVCDKDDLQAVKLRQDAEVLTKWLL